MYIKYVNDISLVLSLIDELNIPIYFNIIILEAI